MHTGAMLRLTSSTYFVNIFPETELFIFHFIECIIYIEYNVGIISVENEPILLFYHIMNKKGQTYVFIEKHSSKFSVIGEKHHC